jgi:hypothetical protein
MSSGRMESLRASAILGYYPVFRDLKAKTPWLFPPALGREKWPPTSSLISRYSEPEGIFNPAPPPGEW